MNQLPAVIIFESRVDNGRIVPILQAEVIIGRDEANPIALIDNKASREHASITREDDRFLLHDLKSTNGTWLNDKPIETEHPLQNGDQIKIGDTLLRFIQDPSPRIIGGLLRQNRLFSDLTASTLAQLRTQVDIRCFSPHERIKIELLEDSFGIVLSGELVVRITQTSTIVTSKSYTRGAYLDISQIPTSSYLVTSQKTWLLLLKRSQINELIITFIRQTPLGGLPEEQLQILAGQMSIEKYPQGHWLFQQGDYADALYVVIFGEVAMMRHSEQGEPKSPDDEIRTYERGYLFGELGLLEGSPRAAGGFIKEETGVLVLQRDRFDALVQQYPDISISLYRYISNLLEEQSVAFWKAARDVEKMQELVQSTKMAALGHLVAGIAHEINTPVGTISTNSYQLERLLVDVQSHVEGLPQIIKAFSRDEDRLQQIADEADVPFGEATVAFINHYTTALIDDLHTYDEAAELDIQLEDVQDISEELSEASRRIKVIVKNLANFARLDEAERKTVDIHEGLEATLSLLHHELKYQVDVTRDYNRRLPKITCHPNELNQVFMNIIMNAIQALDLDNLQSGKRGSIGIKTYREENMAVITISDNGKGISVQNMDRIFEPFFSTKGAAAAAGGLGLGLGLAISLKIIEEKHNGHIEVESKLGQGSTFFVKLPLDKTSTTTTTQTIFLE